MLIHKSFRFRIYPTPEQELRLAAWESALRFLWNLALEQRRMGLDRPRDERVFRTSTDQAKEMTDLRKELPWLEDVPRHVCSSILIELDKAYQRCFERISQAPDWKRKGRGTLSFCETDPKAWRLSGNIIRFPKLGNLKAIIHRPLEGKPKTCTLKRDGDQWFASIVCEVEYDDKPIRTQPMVAIDRGVINIIADSDGRLLPSPHYYGQTMKRLAHAQRTVSRRKKGSKNREKAKVRVMRLHRKVRRQRKHFLHVLSHDYAKNHGTVVIEKLPIQGMVQANSGLARGILDAGWGYFAEMLRYKLSWNNGQLIRVPAHYSSQTCAKCDNINAANRKSRDDFQCIACGHIDHADLNAAKVLLARANRSGLPVEGSVLKAALRSRKVLRVPKRHKTQISNL